jgi:hypothetical protein
MSGTFDERIDMLLDQVGEGDLVMKVEASLPYAGVQEVGYWVTGPDAGSVIHNHPGGGETHFARDALYSTLDENMGTLASSAITETGSDLVDGAKQVAVRIADKQSMLSPRQSGRLAASAHASVIDDGVVVFDRPGS